MVEDLSPKAFPKKETLRDAEDQYVDETLQRFKDWAVDFVTEEGLRSEFRETMEIVREIESEHLVSLRDELTPLVLMYARSAEMLLSSGSIDKLKFPKPVVSPNFDQLVTLLETHEKESPPTIFKEFADQELLKKYGTDDVGNLAWFTKHLMQNAADVTDGNLEKGGSAIERDLDRLMRENFSDLPAPPERVTRATFLKSLDLRRCENVVWGIVYNSKFNKDNEAFNDEQILRVGEYGPDFSVRLFGAMQRMLNATLAVKEPSREIAISHQEVIAKTARGRDDITFGAWRALQEGIVTLFQTLSLFTAEKIPGYDDPQILLRDIVAGGLPNQLAHLAPAGTIGPLTLMGKYIPGLIIRNDSGLPAIDPTIKAKLLARKKSEFGRKISDYLHMPEDAAMRLPAVGRGCPVAFESDEIKTTGIREISKLSVEFIRRTNV